MPMFTGVRLHDPFRAEILADNREQNRLHGRGAEGSAVARNRERQKSECAVERAADYLVRHADLIAEASLRLGVPVERLIVAAARKAGTLRGTSNGRQRR